MPTLHLKPTIAAAAFLWAGAIGFANAQAPQVPPRNLQAEEANRKLVLSFYDRFFNKHEVDAASVIAEDYKQHNPYVPNGKEPFVNFFAGVFQKNPESAARIVRSAVDGDLVYLHVHSKRNPAERGSAVVDIFRVSGGKIVEHWDVVQPVPEKAANDNRMF